MTEKWHMPGFADSGPTEDEKLFQDADGRYAHKPVVHGASPERRATDQFQRDNEALVDKKLNALHRHGKDVDGRLSDLVDVVAALAASVKAVDTRMDGMQSDQKKNNEMTEKILVITSGGKFIVGVIKFFGVLAVPLTAIYTLWYVMTHGGSPPTGP